MGRGAPAEPFEHYHRPLPHRKATVIQVHKELLNRPRFGRDGPYLRGQEGDRLPRNCGQASDRHMRSRSVEALQVIPESLQLRVLEKAGLAANHGYGPEADRAVPAAGNQKAAGRRE